MRADVSDHIANAIAEKRADKMRYWGRCSCGTTTHMRYSTPESARTAIRRTHIADIQLNERQDA